VLHSTKIRLGIQLPDLLELLHQLETEIIDLRSKASAPLQNS
jgi:hypothetical protein